MHINAGLHDVRLTGEPLTRQVSPEQYRRNLGVIIDRLRSKTGAKIIWALSTPIDTDTAFKLKKFRRDADVSIYNAIAREVMTQLGVPINDLYQFVIDGGRERMISKDGAHFTPEGYAELGNRVAQLIRDALGSNGQS